MAKHTYEVDVAMVVEVSRTRVTIDTEAPGTHEEKLKAAASEKIDVRAGGLSIADDRFVSHQFVDGVLNWNQID